MCQTFVRFASDLGITAPMGLVEQPMALVKQPIKLVNEHILKILDTKFIFATFFMQNLRSHCIFYIYEVKKFTKIAMFTKNEQRLIMNSYKFLSFVAVTCRSRSGKYTKMITSLRQNTGKLRKVLFLGCQQVKKVYHYTKRVSVGVLRHYFGR